MLLSGKRYLQIKNTTSVKQLDWALSLTIFAFGLGFIFFGVDKNFGIQQFWGSFYSFWKRWFTVCLSRFSKL